MKYPPLPWETTITTGIQAYLTGSRNAGITLGVSVPLDGGAVELCKERARTEIARQQAEADKARLDFETGSSFEMW